MSIAIYDKGGGSFEENARSAAKETMSCEDVPELNLGINDAAAELCKHRLVVGHLSDEQWNALVDGPLDTVHLIIRVSSVGASGMSDCRAPYRLPDDGPWILHLSEPSKDVTQARWVEIFKAVEGLDRKKTNIPEDVASIFDPNPEDCLALRLLCEAWSLNAGDAQKEFKGGIIVHAPTTLPTWLEPFGEGATTESVAKRMGHSEAHAMALFDVIKTTSDNEAIKAAVETFLETQRG